MDVEHARLQDPAPAQDVPKPPSISRLLSGLSEEQAALVATFAVEHGVVCQIDGVDASQRVVLPLQPEVLQALLLQRLQHARETIARVRPESTRRVAWMASFQGVWW